MSVMLPPPPSSVRLRALENLKHIKPFKRGGEKNSHTDRVGKYVQPRDRIAFWNIVPGDAVRVRTGGKREQNADGTFSRTRVPYEGIVDTINRERNLVWLRAPENGDESLVPRFKKHMLPQMMNKDKGIDAGISPNVMWKPKPVHYSNLQLRLPEDLVVAKELGLDLKKGVYAKRVDRLGRVRFDRKKEQYVWARGALVEASDGHHYRIEIPFKPDEKREGPRREYTASKNVVLSETWTPWAPTAPVWLLPRRPVSSPHSVERTLIALRARAKAAQAKGADVHGKVSLGVAAMRAANKARQEMLTKHLEEGTDAKWSTLADNVDVSTLPKFDPTMVPGRSEESKRLTPYEGFVKQLIRKTKAPLLPQPPTPSELLWMTQNSLRKWFVRKTEEQKAVQDAEEEASESLFTALDYLDVAPVGGPESSRWQAMPSSTESDAETRLARDEFGRLINADNVTLDDVNSWPIELLMTQDLSNEYGKAQRQKRFVQRTKDKEESKLAEAREQKANLAALRAATLK